jgi:hypothetical protein
MRPDSKNTGAREMSIAGQRLCKDATIPKPFLSNSHGTVEELLEAVFSVRSVPGIYKGVSFEPAARE